MLEGAWTQITPDGLEDITCQHTETGSVEYVQVKTDEYPTGPWTVARLCQHERPGVAGSSILGRLLEGKPLPDGTSFRLLLNAPLNPELGLLQDRTTAARAQTLSHLVQRLAGVAPQGARTVPWCLERLYLEVVASDADSLEAMLMRELGFALLRFEIGLLFDEADSLMEGVVGYVQGRSRPASVAPITILEFETQLRTRAANAIRGTDVAQGATAPKLGEKLRNAGLLSEIIRSMQDDRFAFTRECRSALPDRAAVLSELVKQIRMQCVPLALQLREGTLHSGAEMFAATSAAVRDVWHTGRFEEKGVPLSLAYGALHDITARCQHRYA
jgi:hypothetical protein